MIKKLNLHEAFQRLCRATKKWGVWIGFEYNLDDYRGILRAAPYLNLLDDGQILGDGQGVILCDTRKEMEAIYDQTVGENGPTKTNRYKGSDRVYALTCSPTGKLLSENT